MHVAYPFPPSQLDQIANFLYQGNSSYSNLFIFSARELQETVDLATILIITHLVLVTARLLSKSTGGVWNFRTAVNYWRGRQPLWACWVINRGITAVFCNSFLPITACRFGIQFRKAAGERKVVASVDWITITSAASRCQENVLGAPNYALLRAQKHRRWLCV